jgi:hypothetical protein
VLDILDSLEEAGIPFATPHTLDGDPVAWERLSIEQGSINRAR